MIILKTIKLIYKYYRLCSSKYLFIRCTIRENILFSKKEFNFDKNFLNNIIEKSGLEKFINSLPLGMETQIGELEQNCRVVKFKELG